MIIARTLSDLRDVVNAWRAEDLSHAVVPTMGALHEGHQMLVAAAREKADRVIATIFVNPKQFAANEDLSRYPRDEEGDLAKLEAAGCDLAYLPAQQALRWRPAVREFVPLFLNYRRQ